MKINSIVNLHILWTIILVLCISLAVFEGAAIAQDTTPPPDPLSTASLEPSAVASNTATLPSETATAIPTANATETWSEMPSSVTTALPSETVTEPIPLTPTSALSPKQSLTLNTIGFRPGPFPGVPLHFLGETAELQGYKISLKSIAITNNILEVEVNLSNGSANAIHLFSALHLYKTDKQVFPATNLDEEQILASHASSDITLEYTLAEPLTSENLSNYQLVYMPLGYSGAIFTFSLGMRPQQFATPPQLKEDMPQVVYGTTGDPWKVLVLIYPNINTNYVDLDGHTKHLTASMPIQDLINMKTAFLNLPHRRIVYSYSAQTAEIEANVVTVNRSLTSLEKIYNGYWPSPAITRQEMNIYAPKGKYDSVIIFWQASHPTTGQSIPDGGGWGWGYWPGETYANGMTYASIYNLSWVWTTSNQACHGEVFLHEWLHGVTGFYMSKGVPFNVQDLHGAEEAGYSWDYNDGCWDSWLKVYMRGLVYEAGKRKALVPQLTWYKGSLTTWTIRGWRGEYFNNQTLSGIPAMVRDDNAVNFEWRSYSPHPLINSDHFSTRWTKTQKFSTAGYYRFNAFRDDGMRVWVDNRLIIDKWKYGREYITKDYYLTSGWHTIRVAAYEIDGWASAKLTIQFLRR